MEYLTQYTDSKRRTCMNKGSNHAAVFFNHRCFDSVLSYGENRYDAKSIFPTIHAECDAMNKLPPVKRGRIHRVDILVIRLNRCGNVGNSKPCGLCLERLKNLHLKGYVLDTVYYSDRGKIIKIKYSALMNEERHITKMVIELDLFKKLRKCVC
jgi:cytidine deaminase